jgi:energy-coupling factor transport system ATP-binding protein
MIKMIDAQQVEFSYPQEGRGLKATSLQVESGDCVHLSGSSGSGKSTLARCLTGLIPHLYNGVLGGKVSLNGLPTDQTPMWQLSELAGLVFQNPAGQMLANSIEDEIIFGLENLGLPRGEILERVEDVIIRFGLENLRGRSPQTLSGGEQQKLALAAISARQPPLLVLDEPLSMLDTSSAMDLVSHLGRQANDGQSIVICEHRHEYLQSLPNLRTVQLNGKTKNPTIRPIEELAWPANPVRDYQLIADELTITLGGNKVLDRLSFTVSGGQISALVGPNGVGKTTLLRTLAGLQPYEGTLKIITKGIEEKPQFGLIFQNPDLQLFNASVREEILYKVDEPDMELYQLLVEALNLTRYEETPPLLLSEGEKRRVALATIVMQQLKHGVLLDEPALGQDDFHKDMLLRLMHTMEKAGYLVAFCTHDIELAAQADQLVLLGKEGILHSGTPADVLADEAAWQNLGLRIPDWITI